MSATSDGAARVPDVSVVIPSWNSARTIGGCLDALLAQVTTLEYEVLVVDSGTDDTAEVVRRYAPRVQLIRSPARLFPGPARNLGLRQARAPLVAFTDTDCLPDPGWLDALHRASAGLTAVGGRILNGTPDSLCGTALYLTEFVEFAGVTPRRY
ncbi:MAG: glycosyltransferase family A protein, partial [Gammaproteobacteria bacterium]